MRETGPRLHGTHILSGHTSKWGKKEPSGQGLGFGDLRPPWGVSAHENCLIFYRALNVSCPSQFLHMSTLGVAFSGFPEQKEAG